MDHGADAADLRRLGEARAQERHLRAGQVEIEEHPRVDKEGAGKELAHVWPRNLLEHGRLPRGGPRAASRLARRRSAQVRRTRALHWTPDAAHATGSRASRSPSPRTYRRGNR